MIVFVAIGTSTAMPSTGVATSIGMPITTRMQYRAIVAVCSRVQGACHTGGQRMGFFVLFVLSTLDSLLDLMLHTLLRSCTSPMVGRLLWQFHQPHTIAVHVPHVGGDDEAEADVERQGEVRWGPVVRWQAAHLCGQ